MSKVLLPLELFLLLLICIHSDAFIRQFSVKRQRASMFRTQERMTLSSYLEREVSDDLSNVLKAVAQSCIDISMRLATLQLSDESIQGGHENVQGEIQKGMDVISNEIFIQTLQPHVAALASEEEDEVIVGNGDRYEVAFDPLDGSSNLDFNIPTGSIFGISQHSKDRPFSSSGQSLVAAGYALYSSSTELVLAVNGKVVGFTLHPLKLDKGVDAFELSRPNIECPIRGPYYSLNEAREPDWPEGLKRWIADAKTGQTPARQKYSSRYICSLCGDFHRTLLAGGWAGNPRPHLRLLYEAAPLAFVAEAAGGYGSDGIGNILDISPSGLHDRIPVFLGSKKDVQDLVAYGNVQQGAQKYKA